MTSRRKLPHSLQSRIQECLKKHERSFQVRVLADLRQTQWRGGYWLVPIEDIRSPTRYAFYEFLATVEEELEREGQDVVFVPVAPEDTAAVGARGAGRSAR